MAITSDILNLINYKLCWMSPLCREARHLTLAIVAKIGLFFG